MTTSPLTREATSLHSIHSPHILTPDSDHTHPPPIIPSDLVFSKQPIPSRQSISPTAVSPRSNPISLLHRDSLSDDNKDSHRQSEASKQHLSLLTAILSSPEHNGNPQQQPTKKTPSTAGLLSDKSSNPSTTFNSPQNAPHGILQNANPPSTLPPPPVQQPAAAPPNSILRGNGAVSEAEAVGLGLTMDKKGYSGGMSEGNVDAKPRRDEKRGSIGWADQKMIAPLAPLARAPSVTSTTSSANPRARLQFAVAQPPSSTSASEAGDLKRNPSDPFAKERKMQVSLEDDDDQIPTSSDEEDEEAHLPGYSRSGSSSRRSEEEVLYSPILEDEDDEISDDAGYQEDEEAGMFSDEEETAAFNITREMAKRKFAFARPTNYFKSGKRRIIKKEDHSPGNTPPLNVPPPPNRRGRGHIRVADVSEKKEKEDKKGCSRHCSPPPSRSRSNSRVEVMVDAASSPSARFMKNRGGEEKVTTGQLGVPCAKREHKGSPMPTRILVSEEEEEDEEEEEEEDTEGDDGGNEEDDEDEEKSPTILRRELGGWKSDDAYGTVERVRGFTRNVSEPANPSVFDESGDDRSGSRRVSGDDRSSESGVRNWIRRASETLPIFRRPSQQQQPGTEPVPFSSTLPPALNDTHVSGIASPPTTNGGGLAQRLEKTLSLAPSSSDTDHKEVLAPQLSRAVSLGNKVTFQPDQNKPDRGVNGDGPRRSVSQTNKRSSIAPMTSTSKDEKSMPIKCPRKASQKEDLGWSDEALLSIRKQAGKS